MRQVYHPTAVTQQLYRTALNNDLGIYHVQHGSGLGSFLKSLMKRVIPIGKSLLKKGVEVATPVLQNFANQGIEAAQQYAVNKINQGAERAHVGVKRTGEKAQAGVKKYKDILS